jgi:hypothetical protein
MYSKVFKGKKIRIRNTDWKKLLKRFDVNEFKASSNKRHYVNKVECALCARHNEGNIYCFGCPFAIFSRSKSTDVCARHGCSVAMDKLLDVLPSSKYQRVIFTQVSEVFYHVGDTLVALEELKIITDFLKSFKKE